MRHFCTSFSPLKDLRRRQGKLKRRRLQSAWPHAEHRRQLIAYCRTSAEQIRLCAQARGETQSKPCSNSMPTATRQTVQSAFMSVRVIILFVALVLFWTGLPTQEQSSSDARAIMGLVDVAGEAEHRYVHDSPGDIHHLDEQPAQPHAEGSADLPELIPVQHGGLAPTRRTFGWEAAYVVRAQIPPYLDGPQRPPDASRIVA
jgi:hypothetical protein